MVLVIGLVVLLGVILSLMVSRRPFPSGEASEPIAIEADDSEPRSLLQDVAITGVVVTRTTDRAPLRVVDATSGDLIPAAEVRHFELAREDAGEGASRDPIHIAIVDAEGYVPGIVALSPDSQSSEFGLLRAGSIRLNATDSSGIPLQGIAAVLVPLKVGERRGYRSCTARRMIYDALAAVAQDAVTLDSESIPAATATRELRHANLVELSRETAPAECSAWDPGRRLVDADGNARWRDVPIGAYSVGLPGIRFGVLMDPKEARRFDVSSAPRGVKVTENPRHFDGGCSGTMNVTWRTESVATAVLERDTKVIGILEYRGHNQAARPPAARLRIYDVTKVVNDDNEIAYARREQEAIVDVDSSGGFVFEKISPGTKLVAGISMIGSEQFVFSTAEFLVLPGDVHDLGLLQHSDTMCTIRINANAAAFQDDVVPMFRANLVFTGVGGDPADVELLLRSGVEMTVHGLNPGMWNLTARLVGGVRLRPGWAFGASYLQQSIEVAQFSRHSVAFPVVQLATFDLHLTGFSEGTNASAILVPRDQSGSVCRFPVKIEGASRRIEGLRAPSGPYTMFVLPEDGEGASVAMLDVEVATGVVVVAEASDGVRQRVKHPGRRGDRPRVASFLIRARAGGSPSVEFRVASFDDDGIADLGFLPQGAELECSRAEGSWMVQGGDAVWTLRPKPR